MHINLSTIEKWLDRDVYHSVFQEQLLELFPLVTHPIVCYIYVEALCKLDSCRN